MTNDIITSSNEIQEAAFGEELMQRYIKFLDVADKSASTYATALKQFGVFLFNGNISNPQREDVLNFRECLKNTGHKATTVQNYITAVKLFFKWTAQEGLYPDIANHIKGAKISREHKKDYFTGQQVKAILSSIDTSTLKGKRDYALLALMVTDGLRTIEVARANVEDLRSVGNDTVLFIQGKGRTEKAEFVKISAPVEAAIREYLKARGKTSGSDPLFASASNHNAAGRMETRSISRIAKEAFIAAGYDSDRLTAHSLRHTAVTLSLLSGKDITEVQQFARHANIATTMVYNHAIDNAKNSCAAAVTAAIF